MLHIIKQTGVIKEETPEKQAEAKHYIKEATEIGFFSKTDITQYTMACMNAGGSIAHVWTFKEVLVQFTEDTRDVMAQIINAAPIHYWTYLPGKVKKYDRSL